MHRYTLSTVRIVLKEYLQEYITKLDASLQHQNFLGDQLTRTAAELLNTVAMPADVTSADPDQLIADCERALGGPIDVIVHAAGSQHRELWLLGSGLAGLALVRRHQ